MIVMSKLPLASKVSSLSQQQEPNSIIKTQAASHTIRIRTDSQPHKIVNNKYPFNKIWHAAEYVEGIDAQQLLNDTSNFSDGIDFEADLFVSHCRADWTTSNIRDGTKFQQHFK